MPAELPPEPRSIFDQPLIRGEDALIKRVEQFTAHRIWQMAPDIDFELSFAGSFLCQSFAFAVASFRFICVLVVALLLRASLLGCVALRSLIFGCGLFLLPRRFILRRLALRLAGFGFGRSIGISWRGVILGRTSGGIRILRLLFKLLNEFV